MAQGPAAVSGSEVASSDPRLVTRPTAYHLRKGDSVDLVFDLVPEFNQTLTISPDGLISLRAADSIQAAGLTLTELAAAINTAYASVLNNPHVAVSLKATDIEKPFFIATGQVAHPGKYDMLSSSTTVSQALSIAGGLTDSAKTTNVILYRRGPESWSQPQIVNVKKMLEARDVTADPYLHPGDLLIVPKSIYGKLKPFIPNTSIFFNPFEF